MRRRQAKVRKISPDPKFKSKDVAKFINMLMLAGKKSVAEGIVYDALNIVSERLNETHLDVFQKAMEAVAPKLEVKSRRVGGATYQVPVPVKPIRQLTLAMKWIIEAARKRGEKDMFRRLAAEMSEAIEGRGGAIKKREDIKRMAEANQAFAHFA